MLRIILSLLPCAIFLAACWVVSARQFIARVPSPHKHPFIEWLLLAIIPAAGAALYWPFFHNGVIGAGDSYHYSLQVADAATQVRQGTWPVLVGQSEYCFNGNIHTVRTAPYFTHFAALVDELTLRSLAWWQITNTCILLTAAFGAWTAYIASRWIAPAHRWTCALLTLLYAMVPAHATSVMAFDMVATFMVFPWIPLVWAAGVQCIRAPTVWAWILLCGATGICWVAHPAPSLWVTGVALIFGGGALWKTPTLKNVSWAGAGLVIFAGIGGFAFHSVLSLHVPGMAPRLADRGEGIFLLVQHFWPASLQPIQFGENMLASFQLGYSWWAVLLLASLGTALRRDRIGWLVLSALAAVLIFVVPVPHLGLAIWKSVPDEITDIINSWPMQRVYIIVAAGILILASSQIQIVERHPRWSWVLTVLLFCAGGWSIREHRRLEQYGATHRQTFETSWSRFLKENRVLNRSSYALFDTTPAYFSNGWTDPEMESRLLDRSQNVVLSNDQYILDRKPKSARLQFSPNQTLSIQLSDGEDMLLHYEFPAVDVGPEVVLSDPTLARVYPLPLSGLAFGFGAGLDCNHTLRLNMSRSGAFALYNSAPDGTRIEGITFDREDLPIRVTSFAPYTARVRAPEGTLLETPLCFVPGYRARVNGKPVTALRSVEGLVAVDLPVGESTVQIFYPGPWGLAFHGWIATLLVLGLTGLLLSGRFLVSSPPSERVITNRYRWTVRGVFIGLIGIATFVAARHFNPPASRAPIRVFANVQFPRWPGAGYEPLVDLGKNRGEFVIYAYSANGNVSIGLALSGRPLDPSAPFPATPAYPHRLEVTSDEEKGLDSDLVVVRLDNKELFRARAPGLNSSRGKPRLGVVPGGRTSFGTYFSGRIRFAQPL